ncbi:hypothetical protein K469DRAFT_723870 [Zopfia rhizophila CBS 207.26]|uniref:DUF7704 domain-containing protein n=1 Tax=Zopfia rhizophila CBS 207.26 TaxID=1314779 RepID=A0A6A6D8C7_9PEZI|nr:hypothetical protein K469DRAFT_723870 [Zopfia rhizophila CBS 207.26]
MTTPSRRSAAIPIWYRIFLLYIEPVSTLAGAIYAHYLQSKYLELTHAATAPVQSVPISTSIVLTQLANLYFAFTLNEALVLRCTNDLKVWRTLLFGLLIADFGHLYSVRLVGGWVYWKFWAWNPIDWGNVGFVYLGALTRICFLSRLGFRGNEVRSKKRT